MHLTIIAKTPRRGLVKTRLCPPCTPDEAADLAAASLADTIEAVDAAAEIARDRFVGGDPVRRIVLLDGPSGVWVPDDYEIVAQRGHGLGERLAHGFDELGPGVIVAMDAPGAGTWLRIALEAVLDGIDTLGLAADGGYWAIGLAGADPAVFDGVPMSADNTGLAQLRRLHLLGRSVRMLPMARDLDDVADLVALAASTAKGRAPTAARAIVDRLRLDRLL